MKAWMSTTLSLGLALTFSACSPGQNPERNVASVTSQNDGIIGGQNVLASDSIAKSIVGLQLKIPKMGIVDGKVVQGSMLATCTGTLITSNVVLTAAHCVDGITGAVAYFATSLKSAAADKKLLRRVVRVVTHIEYGLASDKNSHDIALIQLESAAPAGFYPATLLSKADSLKDGTEVIFAGYGVTTMDEAKGDTSDVLRKVTMKIQDAAYSETEILFDQRDGKGSCHGDSGGPAIIQSGNKNLVFGVTSRGYDSDMSAEAQDLAAKCERSVIYTSVVPYIAWIKEKALPALKAMKDGSIKKI